MPDYQIAQPNGFNATIRADDATGGSIVPVVKPFAVSGSDWQYAAAADGAPITTTGAVTLRAAGGAGTRLYVTGLSIINTGATGTEVKVADGAGAVLWRAFLPANMNGPLSPNLSTPLRGGINTSMTFAAVTTGAAIRVAAQGYVGV